MRRRGNPCREAPVVSHSKDEIRALIFTYADKIDLGDFDAVGRLFSGATYRSSDGASFRGADAVADVLRSVVILYDGVPRTKHVTTNVVVDVEEDAGRAASRSYFTVFQSLPDFPLQPVVAGRYADRFVREAGRWRFEDRLVTMDLFGDLSQHLRIEVGGA